MEKYLNIIKDYIRSNKLKFIILTSAIILFTGSDLIVKQVAYKNLKGKPDVEVVKGFWKYHYQTNDDIGFSALRWINKYFNVPKQISKKTFENKILPQLESSFDRYYISQFYLPDQNGKYYILKQEMVDNDYNKNILMEVLSNGGYRTSKWLFLVCLQGLGALFIILFFFYSKRLLHLIPLAIIIGGALGNVIDRIIRGHVIDYVMWTLKFIPEKMGFIYRLFNPWPIFNLADVYTITGALVLLAIILLSKDDDKGIDKDTATGSN